MPNPFGWGQNEPQIKPKDQGGDTIATFSQKVYNLFNTLFNTLNSYPWSTATQSDAGYMSAADKTALDGVPTTYLPLSGGTMTGALTTSVQQFLKKTDNSSYLQVCGGVTSTEGAIVSLNGKDATTDPGAFTLRAHDGSISKSMTGKPDGTLTWDGKDVERVEGSGTGKIKLSDGTMILWGSATGSSTAFAQVTFAEAFYDSNISIATQYRSSTPASIDGSKSLRVAFVVDSATTGFKFSIPTLTGTTWGFATGRLDWLAIGRWKA